MAVAFNPKISFVILTWNSQNDIIECLDSIDKTCGREEIEYKVFVVDNGSSDKTVEVLENYAARKPQQIHIDRLPENKGTTLPRNIALRKVDTPFVAVMDSDTVFLKGRLSQMFAYFDQHQDIGLIAPQLVLLDGTVQNSVKKFPTLPDKVLKLRGILRLGSPLNVDFYENFPFQEPREADTAISAAWFFRRELLQKIGYLDENIFYAPEDVDYSLRVWEAGLKIVYYPYLQILHKTQQISHKKPFSKISISHFLGLLYYYRKHNYWFSRNRLYKRLGIISNGGKNV